MEEGGVVFGECAIWNGRSGITEHKERRTIRGE